MSLRTRLLLLSLFTLALPWAGCRYAQQMEATLRQGQEEAVLNTAQMLSRVVAFEPEALYQVPELKENFNALRGDLFAPLLTTPPLLDGFADEWPVPTRTIPGPSWDQRTLHLGVYQRSLHIYVEIRDPQIQYDSPQTTSSEMESEHNSLPRGDVDRVVFLTRDEFGRERAWSVSATAPGPITVRECAIGAPWTVLKEEIPRITGTWRASASGYAIELRAPLAFFGAQLAVIPLDQGVANAPQGLVWLHRSSESLRQRIEQLILRGLRVSVVDAQGWLLARAGTINLELSNHSEDFWSSLYQPWLQREAIAPMSYGLPYGMWGEPVDSARRGKAVARWFEGSASEPPTVRAAVPITSARGVLGALVVEQAAENLSSLRERALTSLLNLTFIATAIAVAVTLLFWVWLAHRIRRLSRAAVTTLSPEGRINPTIPDTHAHDELGDLARSYAALLNRLQEYTQYLQTLGSKLSHELRTPLTIVSSSLENLSSEAALTPVAQTYLERARTGTARLHGILSALSEATRVEHSIEQAERVRFDLAALLRNMTEGYQHSFPTHRIQSELPNETCEMLGAPELIAQLLDKLLDNALDFTPPGGRIIVGLRAEPRQFVLSVANEGPPVPAELGNKLFESLVTQRSGVAEKPHLGLGLYIVRLIASFHGGRAYAANWPEGGGVTFEVEMAC